MVKSNPEYQYINGLTLSLSRLKTMKIFWLFLCILKNTADVIFLC